MLRKIVIGLPMIGVGFSMIWINSAAIFAAFFVEKSGLSLANLGGAAIGLMALGFGAELIGLLRSAPKEEKDPIANTIWADRAAILAHDLDEKNLRVDVDQGIYLGQYTDASGTCFVRYKGQKHILVFGPPGSGKSASIMIPNLQNLHRSIIVTDIKAECSAITILHRQKFSKIIIINPFGTLLKSRQHLLSTTWNPLLQLDPGNNAFGSLAMCIADAIVLEEATDRKDGGFFERSAKNLAQILIMWERMSNPERPNLRNVRLLLSSPRGTDPKTGEAFGFIADLKIMAASKNQIVSSTANDFLERFQDKNSLSTSTWDVVDTLKSHFQFAFDTKLSFDMEFGNAIDFSKLHNEITSIYFIIPPDQLIEQSRYMRIFINLALKSLYAATPTDEETSTLPRILMMLDEFGNIGRLSEVVNALNLARFSRVQLMFGLQNISQLRPYGDQVGSFFSGAGATVTFKTGAMDTATAEHISKAVGNTPIRVTTETGHGENITPHALPMIRPEDIARLEPFKTIAMIEPCPWPIKLNNPIYRDTKFSAGLAPHPYEHEPKPNWPHNTVTSKQKKGKAPRST